MSEFEQIVIDFLSESDQLIGKIDDLSLEATVELYNMLEMVAGSSTENRQSIDTELRVRICNNLDVVLEHIVDIAPLSLHADVNIYTPAIQGHRRWSNTELMKDKGLTGYMLAKEIGARSVMFFGTKPEDYPYLTDLSDMQFEYTDSASGTKEVYYKHLQDNYSKMDILILHGMYPETMNYLHEYRKLRPDGKVYCGLDMNGYWMKDIDWGNPFIQRFSSQCDMVATSCKSLRDALNRNPSVAFSCRYFPNGFYNPANYRVSAVANMKENVIITVGRIGTPQKNNAELMAAFARASNALRNWKLKLIGNIDPEFQTFINRFFRERPDLKDRVIFTGAISDKAELYKEYAKAKIFVLTSYFEGGTPNVFAEALFHGCMFVTSDIDAADDITNMGELGITYKFGDIDGLQKSLIRLCANASAKSFHTHIPKALAYATRYYDWNRNAKKLAYAFLKPDVLAAGNLP